MKRMLLILSVLCSISMAQDKPRVFVFAHGDIPPGNVLKALYSDMEKALQNSGKWRVADQSQALKARIDLEHAYQMSRAVPDNQIVETGKKLGVQYVIYIESSNVQGQYLLEAKMVSMETEEIVGTMASTRSTFSRVSDTKTCAQELIKQFMNEGESTAYGTGIFLDQNYKADPLSEEFVEVVKSMVKFRQGTCGDGGIEVQVKAKNKGCDRTCRIDVSVVGVDCGTGEELQAVRGYVEGASERDAQKKLNNPNEIVLQGAGASFREILKRRLNEWSMKK